MSAIDAWQFLWLVVLTAAMIAAYVTDWDDVLGHPRYPMRRDAPKPPEPVEPTPHHRRRRGGRR